MPDGKWGETMIIDYDTRPNATVDEKLRSLIDSIMLALNETGISTDSKVSAESESKGESIATLEAQVRQINGSLASMDSDIDGLDGRVDALEDRWTPPTAPTTDGAYVLTVTVTGGLPVYTWELAGGE